MQKAYQQIFIEILWLMLSLGLTTLLALFLFGRTFLTSLDIQLYDTYFVIEPLYVLLPMFFLVTFIFYFVKEFHNSFSHALPNWILILIGLALVISLTLSVETVSQFFAGGWVVYPRLSTSGPDKAPEAREVPLAKAITSFFTGIQMLILTMLLVVVYRWGRQNQTG